MKSQTKAALVIPVFAFTLIAAGGNAHGQTLPYQVRGTRTDMIPKATFTIRQPNVASRGGGIGDYQLKVNAERQRACREFENLARAGAYDGRYSRNAVGQFSKYARIAQANNAWNRCNAK